MKTMKIKFPITVWYEPEAFKRVNETMASFGLKDQKIGLGGDLGDTTVTIKDVADDFVLPETDFENMRSKLQEIYDEHFQHIEQCKVTVKRPIVSYV